MNLIWIRFGLVFIASILFTAGCTGQVEIVGNSSQTPNALVGKLYEGDGTTPAQNVRINIRHRNYYAFIPVAGSTGQLTDTVYDYTDNRGWFAFDTTLKDGVYVIEAKSGNNVVFADSIAIVKSNGTDTLAPFILKPAGVIKGSICLPEGGNQRKVFVRIAGIDRFTAVNDSGMFTFDGLAEGCYDVNILPTLDNYDVFDTLNIPVRSGDTTALGTINLPFNGVPTIKDINISYDTLRQWVLLKWSRPVTGKVNCFNVYRRAINPTTAIFTQLNMFPVTGTQFIDSLGEQNRTYEYRITAVDSITASEGPKSAAVSALIAIYDITPRNVVLIYDTMKQTVTLHWSNPDITLVTGYNIYRRNVDLNETFWTPFSKGIVRDTFFIDSAFNLSPDYNFAVSDSIGVKEPLYEYCVGALIKDKREGRRSTGLPVLISLKYILPVNINCKFDTLNKAVILNWSRLNVDIVKSYNIYRCDITSGETAIIQINRTAVGDTLFTDTIAAYNRTYEYSIESIMINSRARVKSAPVRVCTELPQSGIQAVLTKTAVLK